MSAYLIPDSFVNEVLARIDIVELIGGRLPLRKAGANYVANCPFHQEKTPSFSVNREKQFYHCFGCGVSGNAIHFLRGIDGLSFTEAVCRLSEQLGLPVPTPTATDQGEQTQQREIYAILSKAQAYFEQQLQMSHSAKPAISYLKRRGIEAETAARYGLGFAPAGWDNLLKQLNNLHVDRKLMVQAGLIVNKDNKQCYDRFRHRVMFPIRDTRGQILGFGGRVLGQGEPKYLNSPETPVFNKKQVLYGVYEAKKDTSKLASIIVVEGYLDVLALSQIKQSNVVATLGTALTVEHIKQLFSWVNELIFCFDGDSAGRRACWRALEYCLPHMKDGRRVCFCLLPAGYDPDSYIQAFGAEKFHQALKNAQPLSDYLFKALEHKYPLDKMDDRALFGAKAKILLERLPKGIFREMMYDRLGQLVRLDSHQLKSQETSVVRPPVFAKKSIKILTALSPAMMASVLLLRHRDLVVELTADFLADCARISEAEIDVFVHIVRDIQENAAISVAECLAGLSDECQHIKQKIQAVMTREDLLEESQSTEKEFSGALMRIGEQVRELRLDALFAKYKQLSLSPEGLSQTEREQLQQLLQER